MHGPKVKRRVVKQGFYSDEEDNSTEEELEEHDLSITTPEVSSTALAAGFLPCMSNTRFGYVPCEDLCTGWPLA